MRPLLGHAPLRHHHDEVGPARGGQPVRDGHERLPAVEALEGSDDAGFRLRVQGRGRLVQDEHGRATHQGAGQRDPLALPARQPGAALPRRRLIALGQAGNELVDPGRARRRLDFGVAGLRAAQAYVVGQGRVEEEAVLEHRAHLKGQRGQGHARHVVIVEAHEAAAGVVEAQEQREQRALP
jgi:hypothetical protein